MIGHWSDELAPGSAPPWLLRAKVVQAEEILVLSYTADLRFFERVCLPEARAVGARVTVVHDVAADLVPAEDLHHAGLHYTDVPVRCRFDGEFHPKLLVAITADRALVAIGSGNATASGWHHNGELWTTLVADVQDWPDTFHDLARWLLALPNHLYIDDFGRQRMEATAAALANHPARTDGPQLVHNLDIPIGHQLPRPAGKVSRLSVASPFLDREAGALQHVTEHFSPEQATLALTDNADGDAVTLAAWAGRPGAAIRAIDSGRYFHGKLVQWTDDVGTHALVGSANVTIAALLRTTQQPHGNCELGLFCDLGSGDLTPPLADELTASDEIEAMLTDAPPPPDRDAHTPRLLRVLLSAGGFLVTVVADSSDRVVAVVTASGERYPLTLEGSTGRMHEFTGLADLLSGAVCYVELTDGSWLGPVRPTDPLTVTARPASNSPLESARLTQVLSDPRLSDRLFRALADLAAVRPEDTALSGGGAAGRPARWRRTAELAVGSALVRLALGRAGSDADVADEGDTRADVDPGDAVSEVGEDDDATSLFDDEDADVDTGILDPLDPTGDPVSALIADSVTAGRLARAIDRRLSATEGWSLVALLALLRVTLIVAAGGGWPARLDAADAVAHVLDRVLQAPPAADHDVEASRRAAILVALAVIATAVERWDEPHDPFAGDFERHRSNASLLPAEVDAERVAHYAADLDIGFGSMLTVDSVLDAASFLLTSTALERAVEALGVDYPGLQVAAPRLLRIPASTNPYTAAMRLLTRAAHLAPVAVHAGGAMGDVYAAWRPKALVLQRSSATGVPMSGGLHHLAVGPGAHTTTPPRSASGTWRGPLPAELELELIDAGLLAWRPGTVSEA